MKKKLLLFANSKLGLLIIGAIIIPLSVYSYESFQISKENNEQVDKINWEISNRIKTITMLTDSTKGIMLAHPDYPNVSEFHEAISALKGKNYLGKHTSYIPLFAEFEERSLYSLLVELRGLVNSDMKNRIDVARKQLEKFPNLYHGNVYSNLNIEPTYNLYKNKIKDEHVDDYLYYILKSTYRKKIIMILSQFNYWKNL